MKPSWFALPRIAALLLLFTALYSAPLSAQEEAGDRPRRDGFWIGFGLGPGSSRISCKNCGPGPLEPGDAWNGGRGVSGYLAMGAALRPNLLVGGEANLWVRRVGSLNRDATLALLSFVTQYYPLQRSPIPDLYLKAGLGAGLSVLSGGNGLIEGGGWGVQLGGGYDVRVRNGFAISPFANVVQIFAPGAAGENRERAVTGPKNPRYVQFGLGFTWH